MATIEPATKELWYHAILGWPKAEQWHWKAFKTEQEAKQDLVPCESDDPAMIRKLYLSHRRTDGWLRANAAPTGVWLPYQ